MDELNEGMTAISRGNAARRENQLSDASAAFEEAVVYFRVNGPISDLAAALARCAQIQRDEEGIGMPLIIKPKLFLYYRKGSDSRALANAIRHEADILQTLGRYPEADAQYNEMLSLYQSSKNVAPLELANAMRSVALQAELSGDAKRAKGLWLDVRSRYAELDRLFFELTGENKNPGVAEADRHISGLDV